MKRRVALYACVSTLEKVQDPETQLQPLREYAHHSAFDISSEYIDHATGTTEERAAYRRLLADARRRRFDAMLVWRYDRFARSTQALVKALKEFHALGIDFISLQEQIRTLCEQDVSVNRIAKQLGVTYGTAWNYAKELKADANHET